MSPVDQAAFDAAMDDAYPRISARMADKPDTCPASPHKMNALQEQLREITAERDAFSSAWANQQAQAAELAMHRADFRAITAAGFDSPGELLAAYRELDASKRKSDELLDDALSNLLCLYGRLRLTYGRLGINVKRYLQERGAAPAKEPK